MDYDADDFSGDIVSALVKIAVKEGWKQAKKFARQWAAAHPGEITMGKVGFAIGALSPVVGPSRASEIAMQLVK